MSTITTEIATAQRTADQYEAHVAITLNALLTHGQPAEKLKKIKAPEAKVVAIRRIGGVTHYAQLEELRLRDNGEEITTMKETERIIGQFWTILTVADL